MDHLTPAQLHTLQERLAVLIEPQRAAALNRSMAAGTYGLCVRCGDELPFEALERRPDLGLCAECGGALESHQAGRRLGVCGTRSDGS